MNWIEFLFALPTTLLPKYTCNLLLCTTFSYVQVHFAMDMYGIWDGICSGKLLKLRRINMSFCLKCSRNRLGTHFNGEVAFHSQWLEWWCHIASRIGISLSSSFRSNTWIFRIFLFHIRFSTFFLLQFFHFPSFSQLFQFMSWFFHTFSMICSSSFFSFYFFCIL